MTDWRRSFGLREAGVYYALLLLLGVLAALAASRGLPPYLSGQNLGNIVYQASLIGIMGVAMTVMLITGAFDLSVASVAALAAAVLVGLAGTIGFAPAAIAALCTAATVGLLNGAIVQFVGINAFIVTLGTLTAVRGLVLVLTDGRSLMVEDPAVLQQMLAFESTRVPLFWPLLGIAVALLAIGLAKRQPLAVAGGVLLGGLTLLVGPQFTVAAPVVDLALFTAAVAFVLRFTVFGRRIYAVGGNAEAARLSGINVHAYRLGAFVLSSVAAGFAGVLFGCRLGAINPTAMQGSELTVIAAAILGGTSLSGGAGSVVKTVAGALLLREALRLSIAAATPAAEPLRPEWQREGPAPGLWYDPTVPLPINEGGTSGTKMTSDGPYRFVRILPRSWSAPIEYGAGGVRPAILGPTQGQSWGTTKGGNLTYTGSVRGDRQQPLTNFVMQFRATGEVWGVDAFVANGEGGDLPRAAGAARRPARRSAGRRPHCCFRRYFAPR
ncbi:ABC transporter permease [Sphingomonas sp. ac-8]|uniref:ABC transporter permease n=1 Tax=Sphingomonas sp. ac-8 TaxID=3242977 RepID=UPI003A80DBEB